MRPDGTPAADLLLAHLESALGSWDDTRSVSESNMAAELDADFAVLALGEEAETAFATFGVSRHLLGEARTLAQELVLAVSDFDFAVTVLGVVGRSVLERHEPTFAGERHRLAGAEDLTIGGVMAVPDPQVEQFVDASPPIDFMRLLPITDEEAAFAKDSGWRELADLLAGDRVDLRDLRRDSVL